MKPVEIKETPAQVIVAYDSSPLLLPSTIREQHQQYWDEQVKLNPNLRNGEVFTITEISETEEELQVTVKKTDYKHYLYTIRHENCAFPCKVIFTCVAVITNDHHLAFGRMSQHTSTPGRLQFTGGGLDESDLNGSVFDLMKNIGKELKEEMGIQIESPYIKSFRPKFVKNKGTYDFWALMFEIVVDLSAQQLHELFELHNQSLKEKGEEPEFEEFVFVSLDSESVESFIQNDVSWKEDYLNPTLRKYAER